MVKKKKDVVCVKNDALHMDYSGFSVNECRMWFVLLAQVKDAGTEEVSLSYSEFAKLADLSKNTPGYVAPIAKEMAKRIQSATALERVEEDHAELIWFFQKLYFSDSGIRFAVNREYVDWVNNILKNFTRFKLTEFVQLKTKGAQVRKDEQSEA